MALPVSFSSMTIRSWPRFAAMAWRSRGSGRGSLQILLAPAEVRAFQPDVVICDIFMPGCNGLELLSLLRQDDELIDTPILLLSSDAELERRLEALNLRCRRIPDEADRHVAAGRSRDGTGAAGAYAQAQPKRATPPP